VRSCQLFWPIAALHLFLGIQLPLLANSVQGLWLIKCPQPDNILLKQDNSSPVGMRAKLAGAKSAALRLCLKLKLRIQQQISSIEFNIECPQSLKALLCRNDSQVVQLCSISLWVCTLANQHH